MVFDIVLQTEINKKENRLYPFRKREFRPNPTVLPVTGKFYARHDFPDPSLLDPQLENEILKRHMLLPRKIFNEPITENMVYGWEMPKKPGNSPFNFSYHRSATWITQIGVLISVEDRKNPKKPFTGVAFKL
ncbi:hypothetical protein RUM43_014980 [Polyplax serrata]|uniref:Uncharacterized protein n=1 Tax=Polyplax serrata TaxID=468196 RepID=A0AAN8RRW0_POLSC